MKKIRFLALCISSAACLTPAWSETPWGAKDERDVVKSARAHHIMFSSETAAAAAHQRLNGLKGAELLKQFQAVARTESKDPGSANAGGDLGTIREGEMVKAFEIALFSLPPETLSEPVKTQFGWHLIYATSISATRVADICSTSLKKALTQASGQERKQLQISLEDTSPQDRALRIASLLGSGWSPPILNSDGNFSYFRTDVSQAKSNQAVGVIHTEYTYAVLGTPPLACQRSARTELLIDCQARTTTTTAIYGFEGRAAVGNKVLAPLPRQLPTPFNTGLFGEVGASACNKH